MWQAVSGQRGEKIRASVWRFRWERLDLVAEREEQPLSKYHHGLTNGTAVAYFWVWGGGGYRASVAPIVAYKEHLTSLQYEKYSIKLQFLYKVL